MSRSANTTRPHLPKVQFRLSYLIYLLTLAAISFAVLRRVIDVQGGWLFTTPLAVCMVALTAYFAFRFPILVRRLKRNRNLIHARRIDLAKIAEHTRSRHHEKQ